MRFALSLLAMFALSACLGGDDRTPDYRYRLTVEVETPEGLKTGSSVIQVRQWLGRAGGAPASSQIYTRVRGEAVTVDLPGDQTLFALLRSESDIQWAGTIVSALTPSLVGSDGEARFDGVLHLKGETEVPPTFPAYKFIERRSAYPIMVTFSDEADPTSVLLVDPDDLAATFGEGVSLKRITVKLTDEPVTTGIDERFRWLGSIKDAGCSRDDFPKDLPVGAFSELFRKR